MKSRAIILIFSFFFVTNIDAQSATFVDYGFIPDSDISIISEFQTAIYLNGNIFLATTKGVWKNNIATHTWQAAGLQDKKITCIYKHPSVANKIFVGALIDANNTVPLYISSDGGNTWIPASNPVAETYSNIVARPGFSDHLYAAPSNYNFMISTDGGNNWTYRNGGSGGMMGYQVNLAFVPGNNRQLFYGSENPLDDARLDRYDIDATDPTLLTNRTVIVNNSVWGNRRPNKLHTYSYTGNYIYIGQEGALSKVNTVNINDVKFIYQSNGEANKPYSYMYGHWTDPNDTNHLVFGGNINGDNTGLMQLYETFDEGVTFHRYTSTFDVVAPKVRDIVEISSNKLGIIIDEQFDGNVKLIVMQLASLSMDEHNTFSNQVNLYPNPSKVYFAIDTHRDSSQMKIKIFNSLGQLIKNEKNVKPNEPISLQGFANGIYLVKVMLGSKVIYKKLVCQ